MSGSKKNNNNQKPRERQKTIVIPPGHVSFRLLCSKQAAGGVIGHAGAVIHQLERDTLARIVFDDAVSPTCNDRVINIIGSSLLNRSLSLDNEAELHVSTAQVGLLRVFERVLEVSPPPQDEVTCRILVGPGLVGAVIGPGGDRIKSISKATGVYLKVLKSEEYSHELIQITGNALSVKKALITVSNYLQAKMESIAKPKQNPPSNNNVPAKQNSESKETKVNDRVNGGVAVQVVFRLLCPCKEARSLIGWKGAKLKALEYKTGASVRFSPSVDGCNERVTTISAYENFDSNGSSAQDALSCIVHELVELASKKVVAARLLIHKNQAERLNDAGSSIISSIRQITGAELHIEQYCTPSGAFTDEQILQINGDCSSVLAALDQVSCRLREIIFDTSVKEEKAPVLPHKVVNMHRYPGEASLIAKSTICNNSEEATDNLPCKPANSQITSSRLSVKNALISVSNYLQDKIVGLAKANKNPPTGNGPETLNEAKDPKVNDRVNGGGAVPVVFKLLCPCKEAASLIGWKGMNVKTLENKTGASVQFSPPKDGCNERVVTISAFENKESHVSPAQDALRCIFHELALSDPKKNVAARLLIHKDQAKWLNDQGSSIMSSIRQGSGAEIHIEQIASSVDEQILQINGDCSTVLAALDQVSWRLRELNFNSSVKDKSPILPQKVFNVHRHPGEASLTAKIKCKVPKKANNNQRCKSDNSKVLNKDNITTSRENSTGSTEAGGGRENRSVVVTNTKTEIVIREDIYHAVFGDNGGNLARIRTISGATVELEDPCSGGDGKVIISGKPNQTQAAQSLLHTFIGDARQF